MKISFFVFIMLVYRARLNVIPRPPYLPHVYKIKCMPHRIHLCEGGQRCGRYARSQSQQDNALKVHLGNLAMVTVFFCLSKTAKYYLIGACNASPREQDPRAAGRGRRDRKYDAMAGERSP